MSVPSEARAVAAFNPTGLGPGFLQPLFVSAGGDNRSFIQIFSAPDHVANFQEVSWPDRDFLSLPGEPVVRLGGPSLWGFQFPDDEPIVAFWEEFRAAMRERLDAPWLKDRPLLLFDIVDTLGFDEAKRRVFTQAFHSYSNMNSDAADRWRDRAILEPALERATRPGLLAAGDHISSRGLPFRARIENDTVRILDDGALGAEDQLNLQKAYEVLARELPELFPARALVVSAPRERRQPQAKAQAPRVVVVLAGSIRPRPGLDRGWLPPDVSVVDIAHFRAASQSQREPRLSILVGAQREWRDLVQASVTMLDRPAIIVALATSALTLVSDFEFQAESDVPTIRFFAPYATSPTLGRDPVKTIQPLIEIFLREVRERRRFDPEQFLHGHHYMLVREPLWSHQSHIEVNCRLAARALKAGARLNGHGRLYSQGVVATSQQQQWNFELGRLFSMTEDVPIDMEGRRAALLLLVERQSQFSPDEHKAELREGIRRIFDMRGWNVVGVTDQYFSVEDKQRRFQVAIVDNPRDAPAENPGTAAPGLTRAPLLVIQTQGRREQLLAGNRGQFFHASMEDIALMEPGTSWVWPILRRQLFGTPAPNSQAALRLAAALVAEAIRTGQIRDSKESLDWTSIADLLDAPDCERFASFSSARPTAGGGRALNVQAAGKSGDGAQNSLIELVIEEHGPVVRALAD